MQYSMIRRSWQEELPFRTRGGRRAGAGRKPGLRPVVPRVARPALANRYPVHVTLRVLDWIPVLRTEPMFSTVREAIEAGADRLGLRVVEYSVQGDHVHLIVEAVDTVSLQRGMQGLCIRIAKALNRLMGKRGRVFADRYHARILKTPREVRNALVYLLGNAHKHAKARGHALAGGAIDPCSSGPWFEGWREGTPLPRRRWPRATVPAHTWLLLVGWRRHGLVAPGELEGAGGRRRRPRPRPGGARRSGRAGAAVLLG